MFLKTSKEPISRNLLFGKIDPILSSTGLSPKKTRSNQRRFVEEFGLKSFQDWTNVTR
jgi:hypothetical protein